MENAHDTALNDLIQDLCDRGCATIEVRLILRWYDRTNWGKAIWKDLQRRFDKALNERGEGEDGYRLFAIPHDHVVSLLCFNPETPSEKTEWWKPVSSLGS